MLSWQGLVIMFLLGFLFAFLFLWLEIIIKEGLNNFGIWMTERRFKKMMNRKQR